jgi:hypothetical protein
MRIEQNRARRAGRFVNSLIRKLEQRAKAGARDCSFSCSLVAKEAVEWTSGSFERQALRGFSKRTRLTLSVPPARRYVSPALARPSSTHSTLTCATGFALSPASCNRIEFQRSQSLRHVVNGSAVEPAGSNGVGASIGGAGTSSTLIKTDPRVLKIMDTASAQAKVLRARNVLLQSPHIL